MQNVNLDILGIAETQWTEEGKIIQENHTMIYSGGKKPRNGVVVKINMKLKRTNATKRSEQLALNLLKEETYKNKYNVEVQTIYERLCIEETEQQPDNRSFNNQCDKKWTTVKQTIKSSLNAALPRKANRKKQKWMTDHILNLMENRKQF